MAKVVGFEPTIMVLETTALGQAKLHRHDLFIWCEWLVSNQLKASYEDATMPNRPTRILVPFTGIDPVL